MYSSSGNSSQQCVWWQTFLLRFRAWKSCQKSRTRWKRCRLNCSLRLNVSMKFPCANCRALYTERLENSMDGDYWHISSQFSAQNLRRNTLNLHFDSQQIFTHWRTAKYSRNLFVSELLSRALPLLIHFRIHLYSLAGGIYSTFSTWLAGSLNGDNGGESKPYENSGKNKKKSEGNWKLLSGKFILRSLVERRQQHTRKKKRSHGEMLNIFHTTLKSLYLCLQQLY